MRKSIGLCGPSGSGKTTLAKMLCAEYEADSISLDNYFFLDPPYKKYETNGKNWELPENIDWKACREVIKSFKEGKTFLARKINWETQTFSEYSVVPKDILIIEGFLLLHDTELLELLDLSVYMDIPDSIGIERRMRRENSTENKKWFEEVTFPEYSARRGVFAERADLVLNGEDSLSENFQILKTRISTL